MCKIISWTFRPSGRSSVELYQLYAGHDNNRDWFALSLEETRIVTRMLYKEWFPTIYWDVHQQGSLRERLFVPPFRDPLNPNLHPVTISGIGALGTRAPWRGKQAMPHAPCAVGPSGPLLSAMVDLC